MLRLQLATTRRHHSPVPVHLQPSTAVTAAMIAVAKLASLQNDDDDPNWKPCES